MMRHSNNIHWEIPETQNHLFRKHSLDNPEFLIRECQVIKEGHERGVYCHQAGGFYIKRMRTRKARKEWRNWTRLFEAGLPTIIPIAMGVARNCAYLVSVAHDDYAPLNTMFDTLGYKERLQVLEGLGAVVRNMHKAGFYHGDLHGGNLILRFDGSDLDLKMADFQRGCFRKITFGRRLRDLADLALSHFFHMGIKEQLAFLTGYLGSPQDAKTFIRQRGERLERLILKRSSIVADRNVRKSRTVNKYFDRLNLQGGQYQGVYLRKSRDLIPESFLSSPLDFIYRNKVGVLKDSGSVRVVSYQDICIKYYLRRGPKDLLKSWLGLSKGKKSFRWALATENRLVATPEPICYLEGRNGDSFYVSRFVDSARNLTVFMREASVSQRRDCLQALTLFLNRMFYRGLYHMDLKGSNILVGNVGTAFKFYLTDTDEMAASWKGVHRALYKSLLRITRTLVPYFGREELIEFVVGCLVSSPVTIRPQDIVEQALKVEVMRRS